MPCEVFEGDPASGVFGLADQGFGDAVVDVPGEPGLLAAAPFPQPLGGLGADSLGFGTQSAATPPDCPHALAAVRGAVGVGRQVHDTEVHAEPTGRLTGHQHALIASFNGAGLHPVLKDGASARDYR
jgi:hypothetical protein